MKRIQNFAAVLATGLIWAGLSNAGVAYAAPAPVPTQEYWVRVPATALPCQEEARFLAERFTNATHLPVKTAVCRGVIETQLDGGKAVLYSLMLTYEANENPRFYRASLGGIMDPYSMDPEMGDFPKYADCVSEIPAQSQKFAEFTGLAAVTAYCEPVQHVGTPAYILNIEGFGEPKQRLSVFHLNDMQFSNVVDPVLNNDALSFLRSFGIEIVRNVSKVSYYYAKSGVYFSQSVFGRFRRVEECTAQLDTVRGIYSASTGIQALVRCLPQSDTNDFVLYGLANGGSSILSENRYDVKYYTFAECMDDRSRVLSHGASYGRAVGAICEEETLHTGIYQMVVYSH